MTEPLLRDFRRSDLEAVLGLRQEVFSGLDLDRERSRWHWEFDQNPFLREDCPPGLVIEMEGRVVGNYGLIPYDVACGDRIVRGLCGIDFCLDPSLQGQGMGQKLIERFLEPGFCEFPFLVVPTPVTAHLMKKYGADSVDGSQESYLWAAPADTPPPEAGEGLQVTAVDSFDERADDWFESLRRHFPLAIVRNQAFLNWRYRDYPFAPCGMRIVEGEGGKLRGIAVFQADPAQNRGTLMELLVAPDDPAATRALLGDALRQCGNSGAAQLFALHRSPAVQTVLQQSGFAVVRPHVITFSCRAPDGGPGAADWHVSPGDGDLLFGVG